MAASCLSACLILFRMCVCLHVAGLPLFSLAPLFSFLLSLIRFPVCVSFTVYLTLLLDVVIVKLEACV